MAVASSLVLSQPYEEATAMLYTRSPLRALVALLVCALAFPRALAGQIDARMLRQPDVSATQIAFGYAGDVWVVPTAGGAERRQQHSADVARAHAVLPLGPRSRRARQHLGVQPGHGLRAAGHPFHGLRHSLSRHRPDRHRVRAGGPAVSARSRRRADS